MIEAGPIAVYVPTMSPGKRASQQPVRFPDRWLAVCRYSPGDVTDWPRVLLFGTTVAVHQPLLRRLASHIIDQKTVCDPVSGLEHTGLYLRKR